MHEIPAAAALRHLDNPALSRQRPGYAPAYYDLQARLSDIVGAILATHMRWPAEVQPLGGETGAVLLVRHAGSRYILKISTIPGDLHTSQVFYGALATSGVPAPRILLQDSTRHLVPYEYQWLTFLPGTTAGALPPEQQASAGYLLGQALRRIHRRSMPGWGTPAPDGTWSAASWREALEQQYFAILPPAEKATLFPAGLAAQIEQRTFCNPRLAPPAPRLIHADIGADNVLYQVGAASVAFAGLLDPGSMIAGDPLFDLVAGVRIGPAFGQGVWAGYTAGQELTAAEHYRYAHLRVLCFYWTTCWQYATGRPYHAAQAQTRALLAQLAS